MRDSRWQGGGPGTGETRLKARAERTAKGDPRPSIEARYTGVRDRFLAEALVGIEIAMSPPDRDVLRPLAAKVAELAARHIEEEKRNLWYGHNALEPTNVCGAQHPAWVILPVAVCQDLTG